MYNILDEFPKHLLFIFQAFTVSSRVQKKTFINIVVYCVHICFNFDIHLFDLGPVHIGRQRLKGGVGGLRFGKC